MSDFYVNVGFGSDLRSVAVTDSRSKAKRSVLTLDALVYRGVSACHDKDLGRMGLHDEVESLEVCFYGSSHRYKTIQSGGSIWPGDVLRQLSIRDAFWLRKLDLEKCVNLRTLRLVGVPELRSLSALKHHPYLRTLELRNNCKLETIDISGSPRLCELILVGCTELVQVFGGHTHIYFNRLTLGLCEKFWHPASDLPFSLIEELHVYDTGKSLDIIPECQNLDTLRITSIGDVSVPLTPYLRKCPNLAYLWLETDELWNKKDEAEFLRYISSGECSITSVRLDGYGVNEWTDVTSVFEKLLD